MSGTDIAGGVAITRSHGRGGDGGVIQKNGGLPLAMEACPSTMEACPSTMEAGPQAQAHARALSHCEFNDAQAHSPYSLYQDCGCLSLISRWQASWSLQLECSHWPGHWQVQVGHSKLHSRRRAGWFRLARSLASWTQPESLGGGVAHALTDESLAGLASEARRVSSSHPTCQ
eukprot:1924689-Rhodomonas_salina.1